MTHYKAAGRGRRAGETGECFLEVRKSRKDVRAADDDDGSGLSTPLPTILIAGWHSQGRSSQAEDAVHAAIHHSVEHLISLFGPGPRRLAAHHIKYNSVLKGIKVMCQLLQLDK